MIAEWIRIHTTGAVISYPLAVPAMVHELMRLHDELWDKQFAASEDVLDQLSKETLTHYRAGLTEDFDPDTDPDLQ